MRVPAAARAPAIARRLAPWAAMAARIGRSASERPAAAAFALAFSCRVPGRLPPNLTPRAFAAARASRVRSAMRRPSYSATEAITVRTMRPAAVVASTSGRSANSSPPKPLRSASRARRKTSSASRARRSSFATPTTAPRLRASAIAAANWGRSALRPDSTSTNSATTTAPRSAASCWSFERWASRPRPLSPWRAVETR